MEQKDIQIVLVHDLIVSSITPLLDQKLRPDKVYLCYTDDQEELTKKIKKFLCRKKVDTILYSLGHAHAFEHIQEKFLELAMLLEERAAEVAINLTGGTRLMSLAAQSIFHNTRFTLFYALPSDELIHIDQPGNRDRHPLQDHIRLRDFFALHDYEVMSLKRSFKISHESRALTKELIQKMDLYAHSIGKLNYVADQCDRYHEFESQERIQEKHQAIFELFYEHGFLQINQSLRPEFSSQEAIEFCRGLWLEEYLYLTLKEVDNEINLQDVAISIELIDKNETKNELDGAFLYNNQLFIIEAKTANLDGKGSDILYKLDNF